MTILLSLGCKCIISYINYFSLWIIQYQLLRNNIVSNGNALMYLRGGLLLDVLKGWITASYGVDPLCNELVS